MVDAINEALFGDVDAEDRIVDPKSVSKYSDDPLTLKATADVLLAGLKEAGLHLNRDSMQLYVGFMSVLHELGTKDRERCKQYFGPIMCMLEEVEDKKFGKQLTTWFQEEEAYVDPLLIRSKRCVFTLSFTLPCI